MAQKILIGLIALILAGLSWQCTTVQPDDNITRVNKNDINNIHKDFSALCLAMIKGELPTVYDNYLSARTQKNQSYDEFIRDYNSNKEYWQKLFNGAMLKQVAPEGQLASAIVVWGTGDRSLIEFIKENNIWKINVLRGPIMIFQGAGNAQ